MDKKGGSKLRKNGSLDDVSNDGTFWFFETITEENVAPPVLLESLTLGKAYIMDKNVLLLLHDYVWFLMTPYRDVLTSPPII